MQFSDNWWDKLYNKTSASVNVTDGNKVEFAQVSQVEVISSQTSAIGGFVTANVQAAIEADRWKTVLTDQELFIKCGGRTGHKSRGAMDGKLKRELNAKCAVTVLDNELVEESKEERRVVRRQVKKDRKAAKLESKTCSQKTKKVDETREERKERRRLKILETKS